MNWLRSAPRVIPASETKHRLTHESYGHDREMEDTVEHICKMTSI